MSLIYLEQSNLWLSNLRKLFQRHLRSSHRNIQETPTLASEKLTQQSFFRISREASSESPEKLLHNLQGSSFRVYREASSEASRKLFQKLLGSSHRNSYRSVWEALSESSGKHFKKLLESCLEATKKLYISSWEALPKASGKAFHKLQGRSFRSFWEALSTAGKFFQKHLERSLRSFWETLLISFWENFFQNF